MRRKRQRPAWHRTAIVLRAQGMDMRAIGAETGHSAHAIWKIIHSEWGQEGLASLLDRRDDSVALAVSPGVLYR